MSQPNLTRRVALGAAAALCCAALLAPIASASAAELPTRSAADIQAAYGRFRPSYTGSIYAIAPTLSAPYATGAVASGALENGLGAINYARYLAGLPCEVGLDPTLNDEAQHGAVLLAVGDFAHSQPKPADMSTDFYSVANKATSSSNIGWGYSDLWNFNLGCLSDADTGNIAMLGHRRWLLDPSMGKTGMGIAKSSVDTWAFDTSGGAVSYNSVKWPAAGAFPKEMFSASTPWSITLNPSVYSWTAGTASHKVVLKRLRDGKTWTFTSADTNKSGEYFNFETSGYGVANCFVFRPDPSSVGSYQNGDEFEVTLSGGITNRSTGAAATVSYLTQFVSQGSSSLASIRSTSTHLSVAGSVKKGHTLKFTGSVSPSAVSGYVTISKKRLTGGRWKYMGYVRVSLSDGVFRYSFKPGCKGTWHFQATYGGAAGTTAYKLSRSSVKSVRVK